ncbi:putative RNA polymerase III transcription factor subunit [Xylariales sp. AK1849]|nr:putative RNA polymerase III transcription factor subunit [Xylariales sp. AK1849]
MLGLKDLFPDRDPTQNPDAAPYFEVPPQKICAIEHPFIVKNVDKAIESFGTDPNFHRLFDDDATRVSLPLWLRPENPLTKPIMSHSASSNNIVLKITIPKRTGRKRIRGSGEPFSGVIVPSEARYSGRVCSVGRQDDPNLVRRKMQDNVGKYYVEAVGAIEDTHRYRGLADFQFSATDLPYLKKVADHFLPMKVSKLREFQFDPNLYTGPGQEIIPPPHFTDRVIPFNYLYEQNPYVREQGKDEAGNPIIVNVQGRHAQTYGHYIAYDFYPAPTAPQKRLRNSRQVPKDLLDRMKAAMEERPIWTRRALVNRISPYYSDNSLKIGVQLVGYQFNGGPWRDAVIRYGVDPRPDPAYRVYQTLAFKLHEFPPDSTVRDGVIRRMGKEEGRYSHLWNGESYCTDGKFWQLCDITDPRLRKMIDEAPLRQECDIKADGWLHGGTWAKIKAFMKAKMIAIKAGRLGFEEDAPKRKGFIYDSILLQKLNQYPDMLPPNKPNPVNVGALLYGMEDVAGLEGLRYRYRPRQDFKDPLVAMGFGKKRKRRGQPVFTPDDHAAVDNRDWNTAEGRDKGDINGVNEGEGEGEGEGDAGYPDDAWAHILDSDLSGGEDGHERDEIMLDDDEEEEGEDDEPGRT